MCIIARAGEKGQHSNTTATFNLSSVRVEIGRRPLLLDTARSNAQTRRGILHALQASGSIA